MIHVSGLFYHKLLATASKLNPPFTWSFSTINPVKQVSWIWTNSTTTTTLNSHRHTCTNTHIPTVKASIQQICLIGIRGATIVCQMQSLWVFWMLHLTPAWASQFFSFFIFVLYRLLQWRFSHKVLFSIKKGVKPSTLRDNEVIPKHFKTRCASVQFTVRTIWITTPPQAATSERNKTEIATQYGAALSMHCMTQGQNASSCTNVFKMRNNIYQIFPTSWAKRFNAWPAILF